MERESPLLSLHVLAASLVRSLVRSAEATADYSFPPSFTFQSQPHEYKEKKKERWEKNAGRKLITPPLGNHGEREREREKEEGGQRKRKRKRAQSRNGFTLFFSFVLPKVAPWFYFAPLQVQVSDECYYRQCPMWSDTNLFRFAALWCIFTETEGDSSGDNLVSIKVLNGFCGDSGEKFNLFLI